MTNSSYKRVPKREFIQKTSKCLKEVPFIVTNRGVDEYFICKATQLDVVTKAGEKVETTKPLVEEVSPARSAVSKEEVTYDNPWLVPIDQEDKKHRMSFYGCECPKVEGSALCPKHGRN